MAAVNKIDSNVVGLRYSVEVSIGTLAGSPIWLELEPNSFNDFGGELTALARNPINPSRQRKKGSIVDLTASGSWAQDMTQSNFQELLPSFMFSAADLAVQFGGSGEVTNVDGTADEYDAADSLDVFAVGDLIFAKGFTNSANNGLKEIDGLTADTNISVVETIVDETPPATATLEKVGVQAGSADLDVDASGSLPIITSSTLDFTTLNLSAGDWFHVGGDLAADQFATAANNGWKRIRSVTANAITIDKSVAAMVTETGTGLTVRLFVGRSHRNKTGADIVRTSYQFERTLGAPDDSFLSQIQSEYLTGSVGNTLSVDFSTASLLTAELSFLSLDAEQRTGATGVKSGTRPTLASESAFNTSSDVSRIKLSTVSDTDEAPVALFAFVEEFSLEVNNNLTQEKAIGVLGSFDVTAGTFTVSGNITAFFSDVAAVSAVRNNADVTLDAIMVKENAGVVIDIPLLSLGDGRPNVEQDAAIKIPLTLDAATASSISTDMDHTLSLNFFQYLPDAADI